MMTLLGNAFSIDEKAVAQADAKLIGSTIESLIIEINQGNLKNFFFRTLIAEKQCDNIAESLRGPAFKSLRRLLQKWHASLRTTQATPYPARF